MITKIQDQDSHWYWIPNDLLKEFEAHSKLLDGKDYSTCSDSFEEKYDKYRTGGDSENMPSCFGIYKIKFIDTFDVFSLGEIFRGIIASDAVYLGTEPMTKEEDKEFCAKGIEYNYSSMETQHIILQIEDRKLKDFKYYCDLPLEKIPNESK